MTSQRYWLVLLLFLHTVNTYMDRICISTAKDEMQADISGLTDQQMGFAFAVGYALFQIPTGWYSDRAGPRWALTVVVVVWSIFTALTGAVYTALSLLVVRFLLAAKPLKPAASSISEHSRFKRQRTSPPTQDCPCGVWEISGHEF